MNNTQHQTHPSRFQQRIRHGYLQGEIQQLEKRIQSAFKPLNNVNKQNKIKIRLSAGTAPHVRIPGEKTKEMEEQVREEKCVRTKIEREKRKDEESISFTPLTLF